VGVKSFWAKEGMNAKNSKQINTDFFIDLGLKIKT